MGVRPTCIWGSHGYQVKAGWGRGQGVGSSQTYCYFSVYLIPDLQIGKWGAEQWAYSINDRAGQVLSREPDGPPRCLKIGSTTSLPVAESCSFESGVCCFLVGLCECQRPLDKGDLGPDPHRRLSRL